MNTAAKHKTSTMPLPSHSIVPSLPADGIGATCRGIQGEGTLGNSTLGNSSPDKSTQIDAQCNKTHGGAADTNRSGSVTRFAAVALMASFLAACATTHTPATAPVPGKTTAIPDTTLSDGSIRHDTDSARLAQLWAAADRAMSADNLTLADQYLLEAIELKPADTILWSRAAELKLKLLEPALAENFAAKSNAFADDNKTLLHRNWLIIEHAREMRGDLLGVRDAHKMVQLYQY